MAKRDGFFKRKGSRFWWCATDPLTGREKSTKCTSLAAAKAWKASRELALHNPAHDRASKATFGEWSAKLIAKKAEKLKPVSLRLYPQYFGHWVRIVPESTVLSEIGPGTFDTFISLRRGDGVTDYTIGKELTAMVSMLRFAKRDGCYPGDLEALRPIDFEGHHVKGTRALTPEEFILLMVKLSPAQQAFVCVCIALGCRKSEAGRVDEIRGTTVFIAGTKTDEARRTVPVLSLFRKLLDVAAPLVPVSKSTVSNVSRWLWAGCDAAGIPRCCPNDLRRTHASWLKELGVDSDVVRRLLGHTTSALVDGVYGRPRPEKLALLAEKSIAEAPQGHDIPALPPPRKHNTPLKRALTEGAHGLPSRPEDRRSSANRPRGEQTVKVLVALKRVADPDNANKVKISPAGDAIDTSGLEWKTNPFDEYALEAALRLTENGKAPKKREGEVVVVTLGPKECETMLRAALATGADRAIRIETNDNDLDGRLVAHALKAIVDAEKPDLILLGKQAVDGDSNQVGQRLAELLDYPMATFAATIQEETGALLVGREVDGGVLTLRVGLPAVVTVDLRIVAPTSVYSKLTQAEAGFKHGDGVRFAPLPAIMAAKKKPLEVKALADIAPGAQLATKYLKFERPPQRAGGAKVKDVAELVEKLTTVSKVI